MGARWLAKVKKSQVVPKGKYRKNWQNFISYPTNRDRNLIELICDLDSLTVGVVHLSPLGSQLSFGNTTRIENVADWESIAKKYRALMGDVEENKGRDTAAISTESVVISNDSEILLQNNVNSINPTL